MSPAKTVKKLYHAAKGTNTRFLSMKGFVKTLQGDEATLAQEWQANKAGALEKDAKKTRQKNKGAVLLEMRLAKKAPKSKNNKKQDPKKAVDGKK